MIIVYTPFYKEHLYKELEAENAQKIRNLLRNHLGWDETKFGKCPLQREPKHTMHVSVWGNVAPITRNEEIPLSNWRNIHTLSHVKPNKTWPWILTTFLLRNKIRNSEPRFDRKAKELQPQLQSKGSLLKKRVRFISSCMTLPCHDLDCTVRYPSKRSHLNFRKHPVYERCLFQQSGEMT